MEMEDHHHHQLHHQQNHHYGCLTDLLMNNAPMHQSQPPQPPITLGAPTTHHHHHRNLPPLPETTMTMFDMMAAPRGLVLNSEFASTTTTTGSGVVGCMGGDASSNNGRWPRQETLTLLEIRSKLHPKFKDANHKGPLWEQVSRIMLEEHGYQRSGKKCREKFENLYKYYKKTKEGKAARQDGKHYRFFRQLEALYGDNNNSNNNFVNNNLINLQTNQHKFHNHPHHSNNNNSVSLITNSTSEFDTSSSSENDDDDDESMKRKRKRRRWKMKMKMKEFIDSQMSKLVKKQEEWLEKLVKTMEEKEKERVLREEEWRREEATRLEKEHMFWAKERAWIEARDASLMDSLNKLTMRREIIKAEELQEQEREQDQQAPQEVPHHLHHHDDDGVMMMMMGDEEIIKNHNEDGDQDIREKYMYVSEAQLIHPSEIPTTTHFQL